MMKTSEERRWGGGGLGRGRIFISVYFSIQTDILREVEEARTYMIVFSRDVNSPRAIRRCPSYLKPQMRMDIPP